ncbi:hypothetical protein L9Z17_07660 [Leptospira noguchii]|nr:hypothetical protein [Leptospira noguchii]
MAKRIHYKKSLEARNENRNILHHKTDKLLSDGFVVFNFKIFPSLDCKGKQIQFKILAPTKEMLNEGYDWKK